MGNVQFDMQQDRHGQDWDEARLKSLAARQSAKVQWQGANNPKPVLEGVVRSGTINNDWHWHYAHARSAVDAEVSFEVPAGLTFGLVFEGELQLEVAGVAHRLRATKPLAFCFTNAEPVSIKRRFKAGREVHKFTLGLSRAWLNAMELEHFMQSQPLASFAADQAIVQTVNSIIQQQAICDLDGKLEQMANVNSLLRAATQVMNANVPENTLTPPMRAATQVMNAKAIAPKPRHGKTTATLEQRLLMAVREIIQRDNILLENIQIDDIAKTLSTSASGIQRVAKKCFGQSLLQHIRAAKLANAHREISEHRLSIGEAAFLAGYKHPSNFALAFKRAYGVTPGEVAVLAANLVSQ